MIVVAGATGTLGPLLVPLLVARGEPVRVVTRDPERGVGSTGSRSSARTSAPPKAPEKRSRAPESSSPRSRASRRPPACGRSTNAATGCSPVPPPTRASSGSSSCRLPRPSPDHPIELFRAKAAAEAAVARLRDRVDDRSPDCLHGDLARHRRRADGRVRQGVDLWPRPQPDQLRVGSRRRTHDRARRGRSDRGSPDHRGARTPEPDVARSRRHRRGRDADAPAPAGRSRAGCSACCRWCCGPSIGCEPSRSPRRWSWTPGRWPSTGRRSGPWTHRSP